MKQRNQINIRLTEEEEKILQKKANERGVTKSAFIRQSVFMQESGGIYDLQFRKAVEHICELYPYIDALDISDEVKWSYKQGVRLLWQYLQ